MLKCTEVYSYSRLERSNNIKNGFGQKSSEAIEAFSLTTNKAAQPIIPRSGDNIVLHD